MPTALSNSFAVARDLAVSATLAELLQTGQLPADALARAHVPLSDGGLGLLSATCLAPAAYWASWADTLPTLQTQAPCFTDMLQPFLHQCDSGPPSPQAAHAAIEQLTQAGWAPPDFEQLLRGARLPRHAAMKTQVRLLSPKDGNSWPQPPNTQP